MVIAWVWGLGWLYQKGFHDFAGSGCVHLNGGTCALIGAIILGPRNSRFKNKTVQVLKEFEEASDSEIGRK